METDSTATQTEVLVAGAGPVGLALALELERFGIRFRIVERNAERSTTSKALGLQPRLSEIFAMLGIAGKFVARGFDGVRAINLHMSAQKVLSIGMRFTHDRAGHEACQARMIVIPQSVTEEILETSLAERGHLVERRRDLIGFNQTAEDVNSVVLHEGGREEPIRSRFLVSCEGAHSVVRKLAGLTFAGATLPLRFLLADVTIDWDLPETGVQVWFHRNGSFAAIPIGQQKWRLIAECAGAPNNEGSEVTLELLRDLVAERTGKENVQIRDPLWLSDFRINARMVDRFRNRRVFVAGDAAHIHSPVGGQGIATGIQDATNLAWKLAGVLREGAPDSLLETYDEERRPIAREVLKRTTAISSIIFATNPVACFVREQLLFPILRAPFVQQRLSAKLSQLEMNYRDRSLSVHVDALFSRIRVRAGDRTPDIVFEKAGVKVSLFQLIGSCGIIALLGPSEKTPQISSALALLNIRPFVVSPNGTEMPPAEYLKDLYGDFARLYGAQGPFLYLLRPDGHVALFQRMVETRSLSAYLKKIRAPEAVAKAFGELIKVGVSSRAAQKMRRLSAISSTAQTGSFAAPRQSWLGDRDRAARSRCRREEIVSS